MPNVENNNNKNNTPSLPKSSKKEKRKSLAVTTEKDASPVRRETLSPITPALESGESGLENVNKNPYIDVINKKLKKLKKFMTKIEKYEKIKNNDTEGVQLNEDQIKALERKGESSGAIKEFEETLKQMESVEKDEIKKQAELKKVQQAERDQAIADAVEEVKASQSKSLLQLILFFRLVHFQQRGIIQLSDIEFEAVETFRAKLTTLSEEAKSDELYEEKIQQVLDYVNKLHSGDESSITKSLPNGVHETNEISATDEPSSAYAVSYSQLRSLIQSPPILESSGEQDELQETFEIIPTSEVTIQPEHIDDSANVTNEYTIPSSGLQFMLQSDDQSQPQVFDANNTTYGYQSTDAEQIPAVVTGEIMVDHNIQEQYQQQNYEQSYEQSYDTYAMEQQQQQQQQQFPVEQQQQYIGEQQQIFVEQSEQQVISAETEESSQQQEEPLIAQEPQSTSEDQADSKQPQTAQQNSNQPPPLSQGSGRHRGRAGYRGNRGYKGQPRRDSGGYGNYHEGGYGGGYQDGGFRGGYQDGGFRGGYRGMRGGRGGRGGGYQGNRGAQHRQRSQ